MQEDKITEEIANKEFENWCDMNDIEYEIEKMSEEDKKEFENVKSRIIKAIKKGRCIVDNDSLKYTLGTYEGAMNEMEVLVSPPTGRMFLGMDGYKQNQQTHKLHGAISSFTGLDVGIFAKMKTIDLNFFYAVATLFMTA